jgi:hypothetical protein
MTTKYIARPSWPGLRAPDQDGPAIYAAVCTFDALAAWAYKYCAADAPFAERSPVRGLCNGDRANLVRVETQQP